MPGVRACARRALRHLGWAERAGASEAQASRGVMHLAARKGRANLARPFSCPDPMRLLRAAPPRGRKTEVATGPKAARYSDSRGGTAALSTCALRISTGCGFLRGQLPPGASELARRCGGAVARPRWAGADSGRAAGAAGRGLVGLSGCWAAVGRRVGSPVGARAGGRGVGGAAGPRSAGAARAARWARGWRVGRCGAGCGWSGWAAVGERRSGPVRCR